MSVESFGLRFFYLLNPKVYIGWVEATITFGGGEVENIQLLVVEFIYLILIVSTLPGTPNVFL